MIYFVNVCTRVSEYACGGGSQFSLSTWDLVIELILSGLVAGAITC